MRFSFLFSLAVRAPSFKVAPLLLFSPPFLSSENGWRVSSFFFFFSERHQAGTHVGRCLFSPFFLFFLYRSSVTRVRPSRFFSSFPSFLGQKAIVTKWRFPSSLFSFPPLNIKKARERLLLFLFFFPLSENCGSGALIGI